MSRDAWPTFWEHNKPLFEQMIAAGNSFKHENGLAHFVDANGEYVSYPRGYITGPGYSRTEGDPRRHYASVYDGEAWRQRSSSNREEVIKWAFENGKNLLAGKERA